MFKIGQFARLNKISIKTLRYYDKIGLLKPMKINPQNNYRYYSAKQLPRLNKILALKDVGFSLNRIIEIVDNELTTDAIISMLSTKEKEVLENIKEKEEELSKLQSWLRKIKEEDDSIMLDYNVIIKKVDAFKVAGIRDIIPEYSKQHHLWMELMEYLNQQEVKMEVPCLAIYYDPGYKESDVDIEIAQHIIGDIPETDRVKVRSLKAVKEMACVVHKGRYESLNVAYNALQNWIETNNYEIIGPNRELFLEGKEDTDNPEEYITEIQIPVQKTK